MSRFMFFLWIDLRTKEPSHKPCGVSRFFCESTFAPKSLPTNHVAFQVFFVSRPSHQRTFPQTMWFSKFFLSVDLRTKEPSHKPCGVSSFFCESTLAPKNLPTNHVAFQVFFVSTFATKNLPTNHVAFQVFFVSRPSHQEFSHKTIWRIHLHSQTLPQAEWDTIKDVAFQHFVNSSPEPKPSKSLHLHELHYKRIDNHLAFNFFCESISTDKTFQKPSPKWDTVKKMENHVSFYIPLCKSIPTSLHLNEIP